LQRWTVTEVNASIARIERTISELAREHLLQSRPQYRDPKCLLGYGYKVYSQNEEDGIIEEIFKRVGTTNRRFVEFGVENGMECNTTLLLVQGWSGAWIEGSPQHFQTIQNTFRPFLEKKQLVAGNGFITAEVIEEYFTRLGTPDEFDLLSIDIDRNDYWVWKAITKFKPRVVVMEYNAAFGPTVDWKVKYKADAVWDATRNCGGSLKAFELLGREKGYSLVGCSYVGANAFFVRADLCGSHFSEPYTAEDHYEPARYWMLRTAGHSPGVGPVERVE